VLNVAYTLPYVTYPLNKTVPGARNLAMAKDRYARYARRERKIYGPVPTYTAAPECP